MCFVQLGLSVLFYFRELPSDQIIESCGTDQDLDFIEIDPVVFYRGVLYYCRSLRLLQTGCSLVLFLLSRLCNLYRTHTVSCIHPMLVVGPKHPLLVAVLVGPYVLARI